MGFDATIKRADGKPLGQVADVQHALASAFPGIVLGRLPGGAEKTRVAAERGVVFPESLQKHLMSSPVAYGGEYDGAAFSARFYLGVQELVQQVYVSLHGTMAASKPMFALLEQEYGWTTTYSARPL